MPNERQDNQEPKTEVETTSEQEKRRRSSDGTTPKPQQKQVKMAANSPESPEGTLLREMPNGNQFRITSNGRIVKKTPRSTTLNPEPRFEHDDHDDHDPDY